MKLPNFTLKFIICWSFLLFFAQIGYTQTDSLPKINKKRLVGVVGGSVVLYGGTLIGLNEVWYKNNPRTNFHFFDDNAQWRKMDKFGHSYSAYHFSRISTEVFTWTGLQRNRAAFWGAVSSQVMMTTIEILDGYSEAYGASWGDLAANFSGALLWWGQHQIWGKPHLHLKFSFQQSPYAAFRPNVLGKNLQEQILKDYNGQTYWLSVDMAHLLRKKKYPTWLNLSVGIGANEMIYAREAENKKNGFQSYQQYYLGLDFHLEGIKTKNKLLKKLFWALGTIRLPAPTLEYNSKQGLLWHWIKF
ncbi:MAG: DUF2279 domain-containing protein [Thermonemataceae bacterium]|nr:DUF2279 domain-containing protein [Thermonemataceae bacterium]